MSIVRRNHGRGHSYIIDGVKSDGVTTLIGEGTPKPALITWGAGLVAEYVADSSDEDLEVLRRLGREGMINALKGLPNSRRSQAAVRGTKVHKLAEKVIDGQAVEVSEELFGHVRSAVAFMDAWEIKPILVEKVVASRRYGYCGTLDLVADVDGQRSIIDYKTGASGVWPEACLQLAAYRYADCYLADGDLEIPMEEVGIEAGYVVHLRDDGYDLFKVDCGPDVFKAFLAVATVARQFIRGGRAWISPPQYQQVTS